MPARWDILLILLGDHALFFLRVCLGALLVAHGWSKLKDPNAAAGWFASAGFRPGKVGALLAGIAEIAGGIALVLGAFVMYASLVLLGGFVVIVAWRLTQRHRFVGGWELDLVILAALFVLLTVGPGAYTWRDLLASFLGA